MKNNEFLRRIILSSINLYGALKKERLLSVVNYYIDDLVMEEDLETAINELFELKQREIFIYEDDIIANFLFYFDDPEEELEVIEKVNRIVMSHDFNEQYLPSLDELLNYEDPSYVSNKEDLENLADYIFDNNISPLDPDETILVIFNIAFTFKEGINVSVTDLIEEEGFVFLTKEMEEETHKLLGKIKDSTRLYWLFGGTVSENGEEFINNIDNIIEYNMKKEEI